MIPVNQAEEIILNLVNPLQETETIPLECGNGRILAQQVSSELDFPYRDNSAMDGYAVKFSDIEKCSPESPIKLEIIEEIAAGIKPKRTIKSGQTARILTGAMIPDGADTVVIQENTQRQGNYVNILYPPEAAKSNIRSQGEFYQANTPLLQPGIIINAPEIAVLATAKCHQITVYRRPKVAIFSTGDELVAPDQPLQPGKIVDSNQYALGAFVNSQGAIPNLLGIVPDCKETLRATISTAINSADLVLSTGGVSVGDYDYVEDILAELGGDIHIRSVAIKPGKPLTVATFKNGCLYFGIPGNPVSALVCCWRFVAPALKKLSGISGNYQPIFIKARAGNQLSSDGKRETYLWGNLNLIEGCYQFKLAGGNQSSANLINLAKTNALAVIPQGKTSFEIGEDIMVMPV